MARHSRKRTFKRMSEVDKTPAQVTSNQCIEHADLRITFVDSYQSWRPSVCPWCEIQRLQHDLDKALANHAADLSGTSALETPVNDAIPVAWMRGHRTRTEDGDDYDVECYYGSDPPDDKKWVPLYRETPKHTYSTSADLRRLLDRARNFIVSNYIDGDLPAFDKPDGLCDDILAALRGSDAPSSPVKATPNLAEAVNCTCPYESRVTSLIIDPLCPVHSSQNGSEGTNS